MAKAPKDLSDDELIARVREDVKKINPGEPVEENAPVDLEAAPVGLDVDGVEEA